MQTKVSSFPFAGGDGRADVARRFKGIGLAICLASALLADGPAMAEWEREEGTDGQSTQEEDSGKRGSLLDLFRSDEPEINEFERPAEGYGALVSQRPLALRLENARGPGLVREKQTEDYANRVLRKILEANGLGDLEPRVYLHGESGASAITTPDGGIFLGLDFVQAIQTESALAFILAHEFSHFLLRHHASDWFIENQSRVLTGIETLQTVGKSVESASSRRKSSSVSKFQDKMKKNQKIGALIYDVSDKVLHSAWSRDKEKSADRLAVDLMVRANYDAYNGPLDVLEIMGDFEEQAKQNRKNTDELLTTRSMEALGLDRNEFIKIPFVSDLFDKLGNFIAEIAKDHYSAEKRIEDHQDYADKHYGDLQPPLKIATPWIQDGKHPLNNIVSNYGHANQALEKLADGKLKSAASLASKGVSGPTSGHAYPRIVFQRVRRVQRRFAKAELNLKLASRGGQTPTIVFFEQIDLLNERRRFGDILKVIKQAEADAGGTLPQFLPYAVYAYRAQKKPGDAFTTQKNCELDWPQMAPSCKQAAKGEYPGALPVIPRQQKPERSRRRQGRR